MTSDSARPLVTIVIPAYNESANIPELYRRVTTMADAAGDYAFEFLLIDNCSTDGTEEAARAVVEQDSRWRYLRFSRNFGVDVSMSAGAYYARGDALIYLFSDLQDPPEAIPTMLEKWREGYDIVYGEVAERSDYSVFKSLGARVAYKLIETLSDINLPPNATDFRLLSRPVIEALTRCGEQNRYIRGLTHWTGFRQCGFKYDRAPRAHGETKAGLIWCVNYAMRALVSFSVKPLAWASVAGLAITGISVFAMIVYTILKILALYGMSPVTTPPPGWTSLIFFQFLFGGLIFLFMGILGHYVAHIYTEVKDRPLWVLHRTSGFPAGQDPLGGDYSRPTHTDRCLP